MYTAIKGIYENGRVVLEETPPTMQKTRVLVMFLADEEKQSKTGLLYTSRCV